MKRDAVPSSIPTTESILRDLLARRILVLDGAMGTMIQQYHLSEADYRGTRFADFAPPGKEVFVKGNNELLCLTQPHIISEIHEQYLAAGADLIESNTFGATSVAQDDYQMGELAYEMNVAAARLARADFADRGCIDVRHKACHFTAGRLLPRNGRRNRAVEVQIDDQTATGFIRKLGRIAEKFNRDILGAGRGGDLGREDQIADENQDRRILRFGH